MEGKGHVFSCVYREFFSTLDGAVFEKYIDWNTWICIPYKRHLKVPCISTVI